MVPMINAVKYPALPIIKPLEIHNHKLVNANPVNENVLTVWLVVSIFLIVAE